MSMSMFASTRLLNVAFTTVLNRYYKPDDFLQFKKNVITTSETIKGTIYRKIFSCALCFQTYHLVYAEMGRLWDGLDSLCACAQCAAEHFPLYILFQYFTNVYEIFPIKKKKHTKEKEHNVSMKPQVR